MSDSVQVQKETLTVERFALAAVFALLSWNVYTTNKLTINLAVTQAQLGSMEASINSQRGAYATQGEYLVLAAQVEAQEARFGNWMARLGDRVNAVESSIIERDNP